MHVLLIDDNPDDAQLIRDLLTSGNPNLFDLKWVDQLSTSLASLSEEHFHAVLLDLFLPDSKGLNTLDNVHTAAPGIPIIVLTGLVDEELARQTLQRGAQDYLVKGHVNGQLLVRSVMYAIERQQAENKVAQHAEALARSNKELEQFAYVASHDLQEPLRMVASYVTLLEKRYKDKLDQDAREFIGYAVEGAKRMRLLINDLLVYSRVTTRQKTFVLTDSETVLADAVTDLKVTIEGNGAVITHDTMPTVTVDPTQLRQVFQNLISNSLKYCRDTPPRVHFSAEQKGNEWLFSVTDNGIGIEPQYAERVFMIFQRLHSSSAYPGTGIGLALCKRIVECHGGRIWVKSQAGTGTTIYFTLPVNQRGDGRSV